MKTMKIWRIMFMMLTAFSLASCSSDDDYKFDASKLEGKWRKAIRSGIMDGETVIYTRVRYKIYAISLLLSIISIFI